MKVNVFGTKLVVCFISICLLSLSLFYVLFNTKHYFVPFILGVLLVFVFVRLFRLINKTNTDLEQFLLKLKHQDFQSKVTEITPSKSFNKLHGTLNLILNDFEKENRAYKENKLVLVESFNQIEQGVLICNAEGKVLLMNSRLCEWFKLRQVDTMLNLEKNCALKCFKEYKSGINRWKITPESQNYRIDSEIYVVVSKQRVYGQVIYSFLFTKNNEVSEFNTQNWLNYIKVISHEIGNGITPIRSVAETLKSNLEKNDHNHFRQGLNIILREADGLIEFSDRYRQFVQVPHLVKEEINVLDLIKSVHTSLECEIKNLAINVEIDIPKDVIIIGDRQLLKQVFINLFLNSFEALELSTSKNIWIQALQNVKQTQISFTDNGIGIPKKLITQVFTPFYSTKAKGSGIGLSLVQQILWKHNARIFLKSESLVETKFTIVF